MNEKRLLLLSETEVDVLFGISKKEKEILKILFYKKI